MGISWKAEDSRAILTVEVDETPSHPRTDYDHLGTLVFKPHRNYDLKDCMQDLRELLEELSDSPWSRDMESVSDKTLYKEVERNYIIVPVDFYEHGGVSLKIPDGALEPWDTDYYDGYMYVSKNYIRDEWKVKRISPSLRETVVRNFKSELEEYENYINGAVYGYTLEVKKPCHCGKSDCDEIETEVVDSCWGFYGYDFEKNGMADYIPDEHKHLLAELEERGF